MNDLKTTAVEDETIVSQAQNEAIQIVNERATVYQKDKKKAEHDEKIVRENLFQFLERVGKKLAKGVIDSIKFLFAAMVDPRTPFEAKAIAISALVYFISPVDFIPDFIPVIGYADDAAAIAAAVAAISVILLKHGIHLEEDKAQAKV